MTNPLVALQSARRADNFQDGEKSTLQTVVVLFGAVIRLAWAKNTFCKWKNPELLCHPLGSSKMSSLSLFQTESH